MKKVWVCWMAERWNEERIRYEFDDKEDARLFIKGMSPVLKCYEAYSEWVKK